MSDNKAAAEEGAKRRDGRSPAYPFLPVDKAIEQARALRSQEGDYAVPMTSALRAWGYGPKSSGGRQTLATLRYYGLIDVVGEGDARKVRVSDVARRIILDQREDDSEKRRHIRDVALMPSAHKAIYKAYPNGLASDASVEHTLVFEHNFRPDAAKELVAEFKETARFVNLYQPQPQVDKEHEREEEGDGHVDPPTVKVGDRIQCTISGVDQFPDGATVLGLSEDGKWAFTDQSKSGVPLKDATVMESTTLEKPTGEAPPVPAHLLATNKQMELPKGTRKAVFPLDEGDVSLIFPEGISPTGLQDLSDYLAIFLKKEARKKRDDNTAEVLRKVE